MLRPKPSVGMHVGAIEKQLAGSIGERCRRDDDCKDNNGKDKNNSNDKDRSRSPSGMTTKEAIADPLQG
jgi:hypothetical protein